MMDGRGVMTTPTETWSAWVDKDRHRHHNKEKAESERRKQRAVDGLLLGRVVGSCSMIFQSLVSRVCVSAADHS